MVFLKQCSYIFMQTDKQLEIQNRTEGVVDILKAFSSSLFFFLSSSLHQSVFSSTSSLPLRHYLYLDTPSSSYSISLESPTKPFLLLSSSSFTVYFSHSGLLNSAKVNWIDRTSIDHTIITITSYHVPRTTYTDLGYLQKVSDRLRTQYI